MQASVPKKRCQSLLLTQLSGSAHGSTSKSCIFKKIYISVFQLVHQVADKDFKDAEGFI